MNPPQEGERNGEQLRLWPGVVAVVLQWIAWYGVPLVMPQGMVFGLLGGLLCALAVLVWWLFFSRAPRVERWGAIVLMIAAAVITPRIPQLIHPSILGAGMGRMIYIAVVPGLCLALVLWAAVSRALGVGARRVALAAAMFAACGAWALVRTDGIMGEGRSQLTWRWKMTHEQELLARAASEPVANPAAAPAPVKETPAPEAPAGTAASPKATEPKTIARTHAESHIDWPGFRGLHRDDRVTGVRIRTDWATSPPVELWRRPVGPAWSSFAVGDGLIYTQEQRGDFEVVACYNAKTGKPVWMHRDTARFYESNGGAGPRGTPELHDGRIYTLGATGIVNALDAGNGAVIWTRNAATDTGAKLPGWGFSGSPLVVDDRVVVAASGRLVAYDLQTGSPRWVIREGGGSYSSPQLLTIGGVAQIVFLNSASTSGVAPSDGKVLWKYPWPVEGTPMLQPVLTADGGVLRATGDMMGGVGLSRLAVTQGPGGWTVQEAWTSKGLKPYFNDFVVHNGHAFGFDGSILACIDLQDGKRKWKGGRYGNGQMLLLADQDMLLVLSEEGELALVGATPDQFNEIARFTAIEGKTWNHLVLAGDMLLVRNGQEMAAFRLSRSGS